MLDLYYNDSNEFSGAAYQDEFSASHLGRYLHACLAATWKRLRADDVYNGIDLAHDGRDAQVQLVAMGLHGGWEA